MEKVKVIPKPIIDVFDSLKPTRTSFGYQIKDERDRSFFPPDFMLKLYTKYNQNTDGFFAHLIPKLYLLHYRIVLKIPTLKQTISVFNNDNEFKQACNFIGFYKKGTWARPNENHREKSDYMHNLGIQGLERVNNELLRFDKQYAESLHNLADELNFRKVAIEGLVPSVWVEYFRKSPTDKMIDEWEFSHICANNTGIEVIDEITQNVPLYMRSDIRQDAALKCLELGIENLTHDGIAMIVKRILNKTKSNETSRRYKEKSLFSKLGDSNTELWQVLAQSY